MRRVLRQHSPQAAEKFLQEVFWRTYWKGWLEMRPQLWREYLSEVEEAFGLLAHRDAQRRIYPQAIAGESGIQCFDAWARELVETGYLHNHARMWFASIWIFTLKLPWQLGADFFYRHLLDGDPASNTLSWRWVGGLQTRGKHYLARASNIARYTEGRFDPQGELVEDAAPLTPDAPFERVEIPPLAPVTVGSATAGPATGLLMLAEDTSVETFGELMELRPRAVAGLSPRLLAQLHRVDDKVVRFRRAALEDGLNRVREALGLEKSQAPLLFELSAEEVIRSEAAELLLPRLLAWAEEFQLERIAVVAPAVGPWQALLERLGPLLERENLPLCPLRRPWDRALYPYATQGFFAFKKKIPGVLERLEDLL
ncbi:MAG: FAD-binding domain-containing protein [Acidobacteriota bacterium]